MVSTSIIRSTFVYLGLNPLFLSSYVEASWQLSVALHAQALPTKERVVGSVITTDGLKSALLKRFDIAAAEVFYPSHYRGFLETQWDLILIEGWFPSIHRFLQLSRNNFPSVKIFFFCLDPTYPGLDFVRNFDIDGLLTNSHRVVDEFRDVFPTEYVMLAADVEEMRPHADISRTHAAVYVGAGGNMLASKPGLYQLLLDAAAHGLLLHGSGWGAVPVLNGIARGPLPRLELAAAYARADVVLGYTINSQAEYGMINNRVFEALSCGAILISEYSPALQRLVSSSAAFSDNTMQYGDKTIDVLPLILFINETHTFSRHYEYIKSIGAAGIAASRERARQFILAQHTWDHRVVQILDFYHRIQSVAARSVRKRYDCDLLPEATAEAAATAATAVDDFTPLQRLQHSQQAPRASLLWIGSDSIEGFSDYSHIENMFLSSSRLRDNYHVRMLRWTTALPQWDDPFYAGFDTVIALMRVGDPLFQATQLRPSIRSSRTGHVQKFGCYLFASASGAAGGHYHTLTGCDVVWFRSRYELDFMALMGVIDLQALDLRLQHGFGVSLPPYNRAETASIPAAEGAQMQREAVSAAAPLLLIVCSIHHSSLCSEKNRAAMVQRASNEGDDIESQHQVLLLLGGTWEAWQRNGVLTNSSMGIAERLRNIKLVPQHRGDDAAALFSAARAVIFINPAAASTSPGEDNLWPFVTAAVSGARIYLLQPAAHLMQLAEQGCEDWHRDYFENFVVKSGFDRLEGFGSHRSSVNATVLLPTVDAPTGGHRTVSCKNCDAADTAALNSYFEAAGEMLDDAIKYTAFLRLDYEDFDVGVDGECCVDQIEAVNVDSTCLMRGFKYVAIIINNQHSPQDGSASAPQIIELSHCSRQLQFNIFLRGNFYSDSIFSITATVPVRHLPAADTQLWRGYTLDSNVMHTLDVYTC